MASDAVDRVLRYLQRGGHVDPTPLLTLSEDELRELKLAVRGSDFAASVEPVIGELLAHRRVKRLTAEASTPRESVDSMRTIGWLLAVVVLVVAVAALVVWLRAGT